jgi:hypothetical protein
MFTELNDTNGTAGQEPGYHERSAEISSKRRLMSSVELGYPSSVMRCARLATFSLLASLTIKPSKPAVSFATPPSSPTGYKSPNPRSSACDGRWITCSLKGGSWCKDVWIRNGREDRN